MTSTESIDQLCVNTIRFLAVDGVEKAKSGHPGTPMEAAPLGYVLWTRLLKHNPQNPQWPNRDRFILSAGHASMLLYSLLHVTGYDLPLEELKNFRQWGSKTPGHPEVHFTPGVETTTGPLGAGFATGVGMAMAERALAARFNKDDFALVDYNIYAFVSDGDLMEGISSEAASLAGHLGLGKLKYVYLDNKITIEGDTDLAFSEDIQKRFESHGWDVSRLDDANDLPKVEKAFDALSAKNDKPSLLIVRTHIGFGSPNKQDTAGAHGAPLGEEEVKLTKEALNWPLEPSFHVPAEVSEHMKSFQSKWGQSESGWKSLYEEYKKAHPDLASEWERAQRGELPKGWEKHLPLFEKGEKMATRQASGKVINAIAPVLPDLIGGSADLAPSNNTRYKDGGDFLPNDHKGRNLHFGIREHAMGAALNGMALTPGLIPYGATFLTFTDYMRPAIRLAALMDLGVIYVMTHDSVGLGEDGPTHQPVEHIAALRVIPNLVVLRPGDPVETAEAWRVAIERRHGPTLLALSRQGLPVLDRSAMKPGDGVHKGGYILSPAKDKKPQVILMATGSELPLIVEAQKKLEEQNVSTRVVSMPSWELFEEQSPAYREEVLPSTVRARVAVEAGVSVGWERYTGPHGTLITLDRFGASAPGGVLMTKFGFTADNVVTQALSILSR